VDALNESIVGKKLSEKEGGTEVSSSWICVRCSC
jgi:hypothetical protein